MTYLDHRSNVNEWCVQAIIAQRVKTEEEEAEAGKVFIEREIFIGNLLVRIHMIIEMSRPALRHGSLNSLFQVALYLPS